jgi:hypothetical protein
VRHYEQYLAEYKEELVYHPHLHRKTQQLTLQTESSIYECAHPVAKPNDDTLQETTALRILFEMDCGNAPHLLQFAQSKVRPGMHEAGIVGGYVIFILMTKMPGSRLPYDTFCKMSRDERDKVREAFRRAIT